MFGFKKKEKKIPRRFKVPPEKLKELCKLSDDERNKCGSDHLEKFLLWDFIAEMFPAVREGLWSISYKTALDIFIVERFPEDD